MILDAAHKVRKEFENTLDQLVHVLSEQLSSEESHLILLQVIRGEFISTLTEKKKRGGGRKGEERKKINRYPLIV